MSRIHHFQRYSSPENVVTNNTLQLISQIYAYSPMKAKLLLDDLLEEDLEIGLGIYQQLRGKVSVPDGIINQTSFKILIEAKTGTSIGLDQLLRHLESFGKEEKKILVALTIGQIQEKEFLEFSKAINEKCPGVVFKSITFEDICTSVSQIFEKHEHEIFEVIEDYKAYCHENALISQDQHLLRVVPTGASFELNRKYSVYYHPSYRGYTNHAYLGFYKWKEVRSIMKIEAIYDVTLNGNDLAKKVVSGNSSDIFDSQISGIIRETRQELGWDITEDHRFFCASSCCDTSFVKASPGGIQGARYFNLKELGILDRQTEKIAEQLKNIKWQ